jgi:AcrR family transcriptional regulator
MLLFWKQGYEGASLSDLEAAMGITRKSMYAAFGNKEELFLKALRRYEEGPASYARRSLEQTTARQVATTFLEGAVTANTWPGGPTGCLGVQGALAVGQSGRLAHDTLRDWRDGGHSALSERFQRAIDEGDLPAQADAELVARYVMTVANGIAVQASGGAGREDLHRVARAALRNWPPAD